MLAKAWITLARARRRIGKPPRGANEARRKQWVNEHAPGRSFADVGGLYQLHGERAFQAEAAGATIVSEFDAGDPRFTEFEARKQERGSAVRFVQGDLEEPEAMARLGAHDIVWCTGLLYHTPNPVRQLLHLREITGELLYLGTQTIPEVPGLENACVYYPHLSDRARTTLAAAYWEGEVENYWGIGQPFVDKPMHGHANFWWGITRSALRAMLTTARFEVVEEFRTHHSPWLTELVARPIPEAPLLPPLHYFREAGEARERGEPPVPFADHYDEHPAGVPPVEPA
jgi:hypothetical protein